MVVVPAFYLIAYIIRKMDKKFEQITILMMDIGEGKVQFRNYLEHQAQQEEGKVQFRNYLEHQAQQEAEKWLIKQPLYQIYTST